MNNSYHFFKLIRYLLGRVNLSGSQNPHSNSCRFLAVIHSWKAICSCFQFDSQYENNESQFKNTGMNKYILLILNIYFYGTHTALL